MTNKLIYQKIKRAIITSPTPSPPLSKKNASPKINQIKVPEGLSEAQGEIYKTLKSQQRARFNKMDLNKKKRYLSLSNDERAADDLKAQQDEEQRAKQQESHSQMLELIKARGKVISEEEKSFEKAKTLWSKIPQTRIEEIAQSYANNPLIRIMLEVMVGKTPLITDKRLTSEFSPTGISKTFKSIEK